MSRGDSLEQVMLEFDSWSTWFRDRLIYQPDKVGSCPSNPRVPPSLILWSCLIRGSVKFFHVNIFLVLAGSSVRTVCVLPARRGSERSRWRCVCGTRFTIWSASSVPPARSTSAWVTATCWSTQTLCASRTSTSGPNSTTTTWFSRICRSRRRSITMPTPSGFKREWTFDEQTPVARHASDIHMELFWQKKERLPLCIAPCWRLMTTAPAITESFLN